MFERVLDASLSLPLLRQGVHLRILQPAICLGYWPRKSSMALVFIPRLVSVVIVSRMPPAGPASLRNFPAVLLFFFFFFDFLLLLPHLSR